MSYLWRVLESALGILGVFALVFAIGAPIVWWERFLQKMRYRHFEGRVKWYDRFLYRWLYKPRR